MRFVVTIMILMEVGCTHHPSPSRAQSSGEPLPVTKPAPTAAGQGPLEVRKARGTDCGASIPSLSNRKQGTDWTGFLGPFGNGISAEKGIISPWPRQGLRIVWQIPVGTGYGMPSISRGRLYQFDRHQNQARLRCFKSDTGEYLWKFEYPTDYEDSYGYNNGPRCCPVIDDERVYVFGAEGTLHCLCALDGKLIWEVDTSKEFGVIQNFFGVGSAPVVEKDLLIVQVGGSPKSEDKFPSLRQKSNTSGVVAFDKRTGKVQYRVADELASYAGPVLSTIAGRRWCFVFARGGLIGLQAETGKIDFQYPWRAKSLESVNASNPVVVGNQVFISECYGPGSSLLRVKPGGYDVLWSDADKRWNKSMQCHWSTPIYHDGYLYGCSGRHPENAELRCIEWATGKVMWTQPDLNRTSLLMVDGHFICLSEDGRLMLLRVNPKRFDLISELDLRTLHNPEKNVSEGPGLLSPPCWAAPILSHGLLYIRGKNQLVCFELIPEKN